MYCIVAGSDVCAMAGDNSPVLLEANSQICASILGSFKPQFYDLVRSDIYRI